MRHNEIDRMAKLSRDYIKNTDNIRRAMVEYAKEFGKPQAALHFGVSFTTVYRIALRDGGQRKKYPRKGLNGFDEAKKMVVDDLEGGSFKKGTQFPTKSEIVKLYYCNETVASALQQEMESLEYIKRIGNRYWVI